MHITKVNGMALYDWQRDASRQAGSAELESLHIGVIPKPAQDPAGGGLLDISPSEAGKLAAAAISAGVVFWAGRSVGLLAALMASVPAWRNVDPLPVLARDRRRGKRREDDPLADISSERDINDEGKNAAGIPRHAPSSLMIEIES